MGGVCAFAASPARGQACCTATGSSELGVVGRCHFAVLAVQVGYDRGFGSFDARSRFTALKSAVVQDATLTLAGGIRLFTPALQIHGALPLRLQHRDLRALPAETALGPGDAALSLRAMVVEDLVAGLDLTDPQTLVPFVEPFVGVRAPTGRAPADSESPSGADVTGEGAYTLLGGVQVTKFLTLHQALAVTGAYGRRFPHRVSSTGGGTREFSPGDEIDLKLAYVNVLDLFWSFTLFSTLRRTLPAACPVRRRRQSLPDLPDLAAHGVGGGRSTGRRVCHERPVRRRFRRADAPAQLHLLTLFRTQDPFRS
jgi:hypothetical protein